MLKSSNRLLEVVAIGVGRSAVLVLSHRLSYCGLGKGGRERDGLDNSASSRIVRGASVHRQRTEAVNWRRSPWRGFNGVVGESHLEEGSDFSDCI